jgi:hypothetical protein
MKAYLAIFLSMCTALTMRAQSDSLGLPGDDLNLCGVLELFKTSKSPDDFEKALNKKDSKINNLDLNGDGKVDYLRVIDNVKGDAHAIIIRAVVSKTESQDVAVIEIEKKGDKNAQLQIVGDAELYGKDYIIEPKTEKAATDKNWQGFAPQFVIVNVWYWPCVSYLWYPDYVVWVSPWYYGYYPGWWYPWAPMPYYMYYSHVYYYHDYYYWTNDYRCQTAHTIYAPRRVASSTVQQRNAPARQRLAEREKTAPRSSGQRPVPGKRPEATKENPKPRGQDDAYPDATPKRGETTAPAPRKGEASPAPRRGGQKDQASPAPRRQDASPAPQPRRDRAAPRPQAQPPRQTAPPRQSPPPQSAPRPRPR